jgi:diguanylate cyclase (GGDEF)-like protein
MIAFQPSSRSPLIFIIDDDRFTRLQLGRVMTQEGYRVEEAEDGEQAIALYQCMQPDIILLDAIMPVMDGFTCCEQLRKLASQQLAERHQEETAIPLPPILMITGLNDQESVDRAFMAGADDYITKPIHWPVLRQRVRRLLYQQQLYLQLQDTNSKLAQANEALERLAALDGLTQIANRRHFDHSFEKEWRRLSREHQSLSLIMIDIDYFKLYNDTYGHLAGDDCLYQVAQAIAGVVQRPADLVARYGGEEFIVLLPNTDAKGAVHLAKAIRNYLRERDILHSKSPIDHRISLSLGVATMIPSITQEPYGLIAAADKALYQAKASGRDCVCLVVP